MITGVCCGSPGTLVNGTVNVSPGNCTPSCEGCYEDTATCSCHTGFNMAGDAVRICEDSGSWNGTKPTCNSQCYKII